MERLSVVRILCAYCYKLRRAAAAYCLFILIFWAVFALYASDPAAVGYAALLSFTAGVLCLARGFYRFYTAHRRLKAAHGLSAASASLPAPDHLLEEDYQQLVFELYTALSRQQSASSRARTELTDYFTLWIHQIKTPISAMDLLLQSGDLEPQALRAELFKIERYAEMALTYARLEDAAADLALSQLDLAALVRESARKYAPLFILKKIQLDLQPFTATVLSDGKWLRFVIEQLLSNALNYTPAHGVIAICLEGAHTLVIRDSGVGISKADLPRIFERGYTGYNGRQYEKSTGLGLYLVKRTLDRLHHRISVESSPGHGATVRLDLHRDQPEIE